MNDLKFALEEFGLTQAQVARELGVSTAAVNQWVKGRARVPVRRREELYRLCGWRAEPVGVVVPEDLQAAYVEWGTPLAWLLSMPGHTIEGLPGNQQVALFDVAAGTEETLRCWARLFGLAPGEVLAVAKGEAYLEMDQLKRVFELEVFLSRLGEHLGMVRPEEWDGADEADAVQRWVAENGPFESWEQVARLARQEAERQDRFDEALVQHPDGVARVCSVLAKEFHVREPFVADQYYSQWLGGLR